MPISVIPHSIGVGRLTRTVSPCCTDMVTTHRSPTSLWPCGALPWCSVICWRWRHDRRQDARHWRDYTTCSRPLHESNARMTPHATTHRARPLSDALLSLGDAPVL